MNVENEVFRDLGDILGDKKFKVSRKTIFLITHNQ